MAGKLDDLRVFLLVAETGSFTKAAAQLGVSQSALSYTVRQLEERLKIKLLERTTRSVSTTAAGEQLREQIIPLFAEFDAKIENLAALPCLNLRLPTLGNALPWEFSEPVSGKTIKIQPAPGFTANQNSLLLQAARAALGIAWLPRDMVSLELASGALVEILPDWAMRYEGYYLYYPSRRAESPLFQALIAALRED